MDKASVLYFSTLNNLFTRKDTLIIGLSGGPDSVFLLHFLKEVQKDFDLTLIAAHLDHEWRPNSADDITFCATLCKTLDISFVSAKASELTISIKKNGSQEALGRALRRSFLENVRKQFNGTSIAVAHHEQDQQETFFIRLIRGTSLTGLTAMKPKAGYFIRPLLQTSKTNILAYLNKHNIPYLTDPTNSSEEYLRNRIRLNVLPALQKADERFDANFLSTLESLQETEQFLHNLTVKTYKELLTIDDTKNNFLNLPELLELDDFLQNRIILHWLIENKVTFTPTQKFIEEIQRFLLQDKSNSHMIHTHWMINKKRKNIYLKKIEN